MTLVDLIFQSTRLIQICVFAQPIFARYFFYFTVPNGEGTVSLALAFSRRYGALLKNCLRKSSRIAESMNLIKVVLLTVEISKWMT
jgi:hypothetical protein